MVRHDADIQAPTVPDIIPSERRLQRIALAPIRLPQAPAPRGPHTTSDSALLPFAKVPRYLHSERYTPSGYCPAPSYAPPTHVTFSSPWTYTLSSPYDKSPHNTFFFVSAALNFCSRTSRIMSFLSNAGNAVANTGSALGKGVGDAGSTVGKGVGDAG